MSSIQSPLQRCNAVLRALGSRYRLREHRRSPWITVYQLIEGGKTREHSVQGYSATDPEAVEALQDLLIEATRSGKPFVLPGGRGDLDALPTDMPHWPEICAAVVAFQRAQGVNMNLVGPFKGKGYFCLLPADRPATEADVRRFALHTSESLKARLEDPGALLQPMATHRQGFRQKREVVSLLRRAGYGAIAPESLSEELKAMVNKKKVALLAAGESRRRIPSTASIESWLDQVMEEDPLWGWVFAMVATYGLRPHEVWHIAELPDANGLISIGVAARHIKVTKTGFRVALPLPAEWVERYQLGGVNGEQRLAELRRRYVPKFVNEEGQPFDPERDLVKRCDNNERLGAVCCHKLRSSDAKAEFELLHKLYAWVETAPAQGKKKAQKRKERCVPYDLRHAYAIRARETTTWNYADVAAVMGHSPEVHRRTYLSEITGEQTKASVARRMLGGQGEVA
jgi:integrase